MRFFIRSATIQIGSNQYSMDNGFYFEFEIPFKDSEELQTVTFKVYNLSEGTRNNIQKGTPIILNAGYEGDIGTIFVGAANAAGSEKSGTDWITEISATTALEEWLGKTINKSYLPDTTAKNIVLDLLTIFGLEIGRFELVEDVTYPRGRVCQGKLKDILKQIVVNECGSRLLIRNNQININDPKDGINMGYLLTPETGLLVSGGESDNTLIATDEQETKQKKDEKGKTVKRKCLLNHRIGPGDIVQVQSRDLNGTYMVVSGTHKGSPTGDWYTEMELKIS